jgi:hypothetical protein
MLVCVYVCVCVCYVHAPQLHEWAEMKLRALRDEWSEQGLIPQERFQDFRKHLIGATASAQLCSTTLMALWLLHARGHQCAASRAAAASGRSTASLLHPCIHTYIHLCTLID